MAGAAIAPTAPEPIGDINTTPLIDVMLVLLIMLIITIPMQTHNVPIDLPRPDPHATIFNSVRNKVAVAADNRLLWNGTPIDEAGLEAMLQRMAEQPVQPELLVEPHGEARYEVVARVLTMIKRANITTMGVVGNERYAGF
jgi:biopolymer transport protein ExbD